MTLVERNKLLDEAIAAQRDLLKELEAFVNAERFNRAKFDDDTAFADWVQSRARAAIAKALGEGKGVELGRINDDLCL